jgi:carboxymethylenebutenolidase
MTAKLRETENWVQSTQLSRRHALGATAAFAGYALACQPVAASTIVTNSDGLDAGMTSFTTGGIKMNAYRAKPAGKRNLPVILVVQEVFGLHEWVKDMVRRYAKAGYYAIAPDLYQRQGDATKVTDFKALFAEIVSKVPDAQVMSDLDAATKFAASDGGNAARLGITGYCWGGRVTWLYAAHNPKLKAGVACYGRVIGKPSELQPKNPIDLVPAIKAPVLGLYGALDKGIVQADLDQMSARSRPRKSRRRSMSLREPITGFWPITGQVTVRQSRKRLGPRGWPGSSAICKPRPKPVSEFIFGEVA